MTERRLVHEYPSTSQRRYKLIKYVYKASLESVDLGVGQQH